MMELTYMLICHDYNTSAYGDATDKWRKSYPLIKSGLIFGEQANFRLLPNFSFDSPDLQDHYENHGLVSGKCKKGVLSSLATLFGAQPISSSS